ncbi:hypothetical protein KIL84_003606 [Mauremys mutica]|uniref:Uncharacterized protein n=1 Tax=Mauremys mutica TaxID=74926 RepID=A0A9D3WWR9_9SAUR|nr:hypothetical protein KIL84_003606 [Mauremys mutica]
MDPVVVIYSVIDPKSKADIEFDQILETVASTELIVVQDNLLSWDGTAITHPTPPSRTPPEKRQPLDEGQELTLVPRLAIEEAMLAQHILGLYLEQCAAEPASEQASESEPVQYLFLITVLKLAVERPGFCFMVLTLLVSLLCK